MVLQIPSSALNCTALIQLLVNTEKHSGYLYAIGGENRANNSAITMKTTSAKPYSFSQLISSLSKTTNLDSSWEMGLSDQCGALFNQNSRASNREHGAFIPPARMVRDLLTSPANSAGDLIAKSVLKVSESVRPITILENAGISRLEVNGENIVLPRFVGAATGWISENGQYPSLSNTTVTSVDGSPRMAAARLAYSRRLQLLGQDIEGVVLSEVGRAVAQLIEKGCISGSGTSSEPLGLLNLPSKLSQSFAAGTPTNAELAQMLEKLGDADVDINKVVYLLHPSTAADLMQSLVSTNGGETVLSYNNGYRINGRPVFISTAVTEDKVLALEPSFSRIVYFGAAQIIVDPYTGSISGETVINVLNAMDFVCTYQASICVGSA